MNETHRYTENTRYSETYSSEEYSRVCEQYACEEYRRAEEYNTQAAPSERSSSARKKREATKTKLIAGTLAPAVGAVGGAAVITAAVLTAAVIQLAVISLGIGIDSIFVRFSAKNASDAAFTAYLSAGEDRFVTPLLYDDGDFSVYFDGLTPDTEYLMEVVDDDSGKTVLSQKIRTATAKNSLSYELKYVNAGERVAKFDRETVPDGQLGVYLDKTLYTADFGKENNVLKLSGLEGDREYLLEIRKGTETLLWEKFVTPNIAVETTLSDIGTESVGVNVALTDTEDAAVELSVSFNGETVERRLLSEGDNAESFTGLTPYLGYDFEVTRQSDGLRLYAFSVRTHTHISFVSGNAGESEGENGYPVTFIGRVSDFGAEIFEDAVCFDSDIVFVEGYGDVMVECVSANGLTLPVEAVEGGNDYYRYVISTEYAKSGEIYSLNIYADNITDGTKRVFETRYITLAEEESFLDYPEFDITAESDAQSGTYRIAIRYVENELFENPDFAVVYVAELEDSDGRTEEIYLDDFAQVREQTLNGGEDFNVAAEITVRIACSIGESYLFYVLSVEKLHFEVAENR